MGFSSTLPAWLRLGVLALAFPALCACQCASFPAGALFRCEPDGGCPAGKRCVPEPEEQPGFCVPVGDGGGGGSGGAGGSGGSGGAGGVRVLDLVFDNSDGGSLDAFPVLVPLAPPTIDYARLSSPGTNLRFHDPDTSQDLPFQIDTWNPGGESLVWVLVPNIGAGRTDDRITLYWGPGAGGQEDPSGFSVFGANTAVWHLGPGAIANSANATLAGTRDGAPAGAGFLGGGLAFTGSGDQRVTLDGGEALFDGWSSFSLELWLRPNYSSYASITNEGGVLDKGVSLNLGRTFKTGAPSLVFQVDMHFTASPFDTYLNVDLPLQAWTWVVYSFDGQALTLYGNGEEVGRDTFASSASLRRGTASFYLGDPTNPIYGDVDEVRISRVARTASWVRAQHRSMTRRFITFAPR